jgi:AraC family transcriptional regulator, regulatory protein of adaptative response / DNA-3-methyladenine glycosylase II
VTHTFPAPEALAAVDPTAFPMPRTRQRTLHEVAARLADGRLDLNPGADRDDTERALLAVPGVGPWTAGYIRMRALADPDVFLASDLGVRQGLARVGLPAEPRRAAVVAERWRPWRSYAQLQLWAMLTDQSERRSSRP